MRLSWSRAPKAPTAAAPPTEYDRYLNIGAWAALGAAAALFALSIVPVALLWAEPNSGADVNITSEFYTVAEGGGGYVTWDFSARASQVLRARIDGLGDHDGNVSIPEYQVYQLGLNDAFEKEVLVYRNFQIGAVQIIESRGLAGVADNASDPAHLKIIMNGEWAQRDNDIRLGSDAALAKVYGNLSGWERVSERTLAIAAGASSFTPYLAQARVLRVPGGSVVAAAIEYTSATSSGELTPAVHYGRFSFVDSSLILLLPMAIAYLVGVRAPRLEQEASRQRRVVPFHRLLSFGFWLLVIAYFAGSPAPLLWIAGVAFGVAGLWFAFQLYPEEPQPGRLLTVADITGKVEEPKWEEEDDAAGTTPPTPPEAALKLLNKAVGPLERPHDSAQPAANSTLLQARAMLPKAVSPLDLPDADTPRPEGRAKSVAPPPSAAAAAAPAPRAAPQPQAPPKIRVRCPGCKHYFEAEGARPLSVTCPHCGRRGVLR